MIYDITSIRPDAVYIKDMKIGQKFYESDYQDDLVYVLLDIKISDTNADNISYVVRIYKTDIIERKNISGTGVRDSRYVFKFVRRDRSSYIAGFQACLKLYHDNMQIFDREKAGLDNPFNIYQTMYQKYNNWVKNF